MFVTFYIQYLRVRSWCQACSSFTRSRVGEEDILYNTHTFQTIKLSTKIFLRFSDHRPSMSDPEVKGTLTSGKELLDHCNACCL